MKKKIIWGIIVVAVAVGGYFMFRGKSADVTYTTADAEKGDLFQTVSSTGDLTDDKEIILNFEIGGRIGKIFVKEGQSVAAGDLIATINNPVLSGQLNQASANLNLAIAKAGANDDAIREAEVTVKNAENVFQDTERLNDKNKEAAERAVSDTRNYLADAQIYYDQILLDNGADDSTTKSAKLTLDTAQKSYNAARDAEEVAKKTANLSETNAENTLRSAKERLKTLESEYTINSNDASVQSARASYQIALSNLEKASLRSPVNGTVTRINNKIGEILGTGVIKESFTKILTSDFILESNISESDIAKVRLGDKAKVTFDALGMENIFDSEVVQIDTDATVIQDVVYYRVKLRISDIDPMLKPGMSANIDIETAEKNNVVKIPLRAIKTEGNKKYVEILNQENVVEKVFVETGLEGDEGMVEIKSGLEGGEKVITFVAENK